MIPIYIHCNSSSYCTVQLRTVARGFKLINEIEWKKAKVINIGLKIIFKSIIISYTVIRVYLFPTSWEKQPSMSSLKIAVYLVTPRMSRTFFSEESFFLADYFANNFSSLHSLRTLNREIPRRSKLMILSRMWSTPPPPSDISGQS